MPERTLHFFAFVSLACAAAWASSRIQEPQPPVAGPGERPITSASPPASPALAPERPHEEVRESRPPVPATAGSCFDGTSPPYGSWWLGNDGGTWHPCGSWWSANDGCNHCSCTEVRGKPEMFCTKMYCEPFDGAAPKARHSPIPPRGVGPPGDGF